MYQYTYVIDVFIHGVIKNPKTNEIKKVHQKIYTEQVLMVKTTCCHVILHLNLKQFGFTGEPVTGPTRQSRESVNHVGT